MPTSASTGTGQLSTTGRRPGRPRKTPDVPAVKADTEMSSPDGAPIVSRPEDVVGGVRVADFAPSPAQDYDGPAPLADPNGNGAVQATHPGGHYETIDANEDGWADKVAEIEKR